MRIERIETTRVNVPFEAPIIWSQGSRSSTTRTLIRVFTDEGMEIMMDCNGASDGDPFISTCARTALRMNCGWYPGSAP